MQGLQAHPQKFWFAENLGKSPENPGKNGAQRCLASKMAPKVHTKTHEKFFLEVTKKRGSWSCGRKFVGKSFTKNFSDKFGEIRAKFFAPQKFAYSYTHDEKAPPPPLSLFWKDRGTKGQMLPSLCLHSPTSLCIIFSTRGHQHGARGHQVARTDHVDHPRACS